MASSSSMEIDNVEQDIATAANPSTSGNATTETIIPEGSTNLGKLEPMEIDKDEEFNVGDIVWTKIGRFPFWPSLICIDPDGKIYITKADGKKKFSLHVRFCNDNGRRSWTKIVEKFYGKEDFLSKYPNTLSSFKNNKRLEKQWQAAVQEATQLLTMPRLNRIAKFYERNNLQMDDPTPSTSSGIVAQTDTAVETNNIISTSNTSVKNNANKAIKRKQPVQRSKKTNSKKRKVEVIFSSSESDTTVEEEPPQILPQSSLRVPDRIRREVERLECVGVFERFRDSNI